MSMADTYAQTGMARLLGHTRRADGNSDTFWSLAVRCKLAPLPHHLQRLQYTASGYGSRIPSPYMVFFNGRWRRVYVRIYSNAGTSYIGKLADVGERITVDYLPE